MKRKLIQNAISVMILLLVCNAAYAREYHYAKEHNQIKAYRLDDLPDLKQDPIHRIVTQRITNYFMQSYSRDFQLDEALSTRIFNRYLNQLDFNKSLFTVDDVALLKKRDALLVNGIKTGELTAAYDIYNFSLKKRFKRYQYALSLVKAPLNFDKKKSINFDREKMPWPKSEEELDIFWQKRVKFDALSLALAGKNEREIRETLTKRYSQILKTLTQTNSEDAFQVFMNAFAKEIDPHTSYLAPRKKREFDSDMSLSFEGIGATLSMEGDYTTIMSFVPAGPAEKSHQIALGDRIVGVGQEGGALEDVIGWRLDDIVDLIRGPKGSKVHLEILPLGNNTKSKIVVIKRDTIRLEDREVKTSITKTSRGKVGVIEIPSFYLGLTEKTRKLLSDFNKQHVDSVVVDLRSNGGGSLAEVISLTGLFIPKGPVVQVRDNVGNITEYDNTHGSSSYDGPLVVLVNRYSASASEIFSAALQDYHRAVIVGETTFGKGTVQTSRSIAYPRDEKIHPDWPPLGGVQYTIQKFYRINGGSTQLKGVEPDIAIIHAKLDYDMGERYMDNALPWDSISPVKYGTIGNISQILPALKALHEKRIARNPEFRYIQQDIEKLNANKASRYTLSLNKLQREKEQQEEDKIELRRTNARLTQMGLPPVKQLDKLPKKYKVPDAFLDESIQIALDLKEDYRHHG